MGISKLGASMLAGVFACVVLVAHGEHADVGTRVSRGEPSTTDLLAALDAEAHEEHEEAPLES